VRTVISCSRRSDVPSYHIDRLLGALSTGHCEVKGPFGGPTRRVSLLARDVHTIVLWSKDFAPLLARVDAFSSYHLFFHFTVNTPSPLEGELPPLAARLQQLATLARRFGPERISWRFDPIVFWRGRDGVVRDNLSAFERIAAAAARVGVSRCVFSFATLYPKVLRRQRRLGVEFVDPPLARKREIVARLAETAGRHGISLLACCQPELLGVAGVRPSSCVDGRLLSELAGEEADARRDGGQRAGCGCTRSVDIGAYNTCRRGCAYCYALP